MIKCDEYKVKLTLTQEMLGTNPQSPRLLVEQIIQKQRILISIYNKKMSTKYADAADISDEKEKEEISKLFGNMEELLGREISSEEREQILEGNLKLADLTSGRTVFLRLDGKPCIGSHMILGFLKAAGKAVSITTKKEKGKVFGTQAYTDSIINQHVRVKEHFINFDSDIKRNKDNSPYFYERSLRALTAQGPRISIASSEVVPSGSSLEFTLKVLKGSPIGIEHLETMFSYGELSGLGQWRNSGFGQFTFGITLLE